MCDRQSRAPLLAAAVGTRKRWVLHYTLIGQAAGWVGALRFTCNDGAASRKRVCSAFFSHTDSGFFICQTEKKTSVGRQSVNEPDKSESNSAFFLPVFQQQPTVRMCDFSHMSLVMTTVRTVCTHTYVCVWVLLFTWPLDAPLSHSLSLSVSISLSACNVSLKK